MSTRAQIRTRIRTEMDLLDEPGVSDAEINYAIQEAMRVVSAQVLGLYEDYFLTRATLSIVSGSSDVAYPTDIWANKVRALVYRSNGIVTEVRRRKDTNNFYKAENQAQFGIWSPDVATYVPMDSAMRLFPTPTETTANALVCWYIRDANAMDDDSDSCDIPEWEHVVVAYAEDVIATNKPGLGDSAKTGKKLASLMAIMQASLSNRSPDDWDFVAKDTTVYEEHS